MTTSNDAQTNTNGLHIYTAGVGLQQLFILIFVALSINFTQRLNRVCDATDIRAGKTMMYVLYTSLGLISVSTKSLTNLVAINSDPAVPYHLPNCRVLRWTRHRRDR